MQPNGEEEDSLSRSSGKAPSPLSLEGLEQRAKEYPGLDAKALHAYNELTRTARAFVAALDRSAADGGLSVGRNLVLWAIAQADPKVGTTPAEIADLVDVTRATVTGLLNGLEADGLIVRTPSTVDRRQVHVHLSAKAQKIIKQAWPRQSRDITRAMAGLTDREKLQLVDLMRKIRQQLRTLGEEDEMSPPRRRS